MKQKLLVINICNDCPHFDNEYYGYHEKCIKLDRKISPRIDNNFIFDIPEDCPLEDKK
jgi:hypothetical protein